jgi:cytochrome c oxidase subunit 2
VVWTGIPVLLVAVLFGLTVSTVNAVSAPLPAQDDLNLHVIGHQWWWEFDYPDLGIITANELHVPANATVQITLNSVDVIHSFWIPQLSGKIDAVPGQTNHLWFRTENTGVYHGQCAEFCGLNHANMRIKVLVESQSDFDAWVANQQKPPAPPQTPMQRKGFEIVSQGICHSCHTLGKSRAEKDIGPNLTHLMSRSVFAGAIYELNEDNLHHWMINNQEMKPGNDMSINPKREDIEPVLAYLTSLK